ncbi:ArsA family ATPase [Streptomyces smyrnaeus]|uniref:ArsA family ATPase n=1 Tax=Streptomyces smyrnaeus TaxID=1387713 RepID=A0ABS3Y2T9_9ACTN|nr:ArsA family ATPase [Streptomyces smyrnaeus]MBO8201963.1 ArsA family ATPase [Streptomyces smyrnaeus]
MVTGAGGAGRTTVAAATACAAAAQGHRTLLLSAEPARRLAALLGTDPSEASGAQPAPQPPREPGPGRPEPVAGAAGLWLLRIDSGEEFRRQAVALQTRGRTALDLLGAVPLDEDELTELPGAGTFALLRALHTTHQGGTGRNADDGTGRSPGGGWDIVVADMPAAPEGLNLLALPEQLRRYLRRLVPAERQAARALRPLLAQLAGAPMPAQWLYEAAGRWSDELAGVQRIVESPTTVVRLVTEPGPLAAEDLRTAGAGLRLHGLALESVVANRLLPTGSSDSWLTALAGQQQTALAALREKCEAESVPLCELPHLGRDPRGPEDLRALANAARTAVAADGTAGEGLRPPAGAEGGPGTDITYGWLEDRLAGDGTLVWHLPLPGAEREELELVRRGDELTVGVGPYRRVLPLPSALRRCRVSGAGLKGGVLGVRFTPDPDLWPGGQRGGSEPARQGG